MYVMLLTKTNKKKGWEIKVNFSDMKNGKRWKIKENESIFKAESGMQEDFKEDEIEDVMFAHSPLFSIVK